MTYWMGVTHTTPRLRHQLIGTLAMLLGLDLFIDIRVRQQLESQMGYVQSHQYLHILQHGAVRSEVTRYNLMIRCRGMSSPCALKQYNNLIKVKHLTAFIASNKNIFLVNCSQIHSVIFFQLSSSYQMSEHRLVV